MYYYLLLSLFQGVFKSLGPPSELLTAMGPLRELLGRCDGLADDAKIHVTLSTGNWRSLILDGPRTQGFLQSTLRCKGPVVPLQGRCDDARLRRAWRCEPDLSGESFPYVTEVLRRLKGRCAQQPQVLLLGLGGGTMQSHLQQECPEAQVLTVEANQSVLHVARDFFGFTGAVRLETAQEALQARAWTHLAGN